MGGAIAPQSTWTRGPPRASAASIPWPDRSFAGVLAVNRLQLWKPLDVALVEVARVLLPGASSSSSPHRGSKEKRALVSQWIETTGAQLRRFGLLDFTHRTAPFRSGEGLVPPGVQAPRPQPDGTPTQPSGG